MIYSTNPKKLSKKKGPSMDASITPRRENRIIMGGRCREEPRWERGVGGKWGQEQVWGGRSEAQRASGMNGNMQLPGFGVRGTSRKFQRPGMGETHRSQCG